MIRDFEKLYLTGALSVCLAIVFTGMLDPPPNLTNSQSLANTLSTLLSLPVPLAIAVLLRANLSKGLT